MIAWILVGVLYLLGAWATKMLADEYREGSADDQGATLFVTAFWPLVMATTLLVFAWSRKW